MANGIWLCQNHARLIDVDPERFTVALLHGWRERAEARAQREIELGRGPHDDGTPVADPRRRLVGHLVTLTANDDDDEIRGRLAEFLDDIGAGAAWGDHASEIAQMALYELARNAFDHGCAAAVRLIARPGAISLSYEGPRFGINDFDRLEGRGGKAAINAIRRDAAGSLIVSHRWPEGTNEWHLGDIVADAGGDNPCAVRLHRQSMLSEARLTALHCCDEIHLYPSGFWTFSDAPRLSRTVGTLPDSPRLVVHGVSAASPLGHYFRENVPTALLVDDGPVRG